MPALSVAGGDTVLFDVKDADIESFALDANGFYGANTMGDNSGVDSFAMNGTATRISFDPTLDTDDVNPRLVVLDAGNVYWMSGGFVFEQAVLHAKAR